MATNRRGGKNERVEEEKERRKGGQKRKRREKSLFTPKDRKGHVCQGRMGQVNVTRAPMMILFSTPNRSVMCLHDPYSTHPSSPHHDISKLSTGK